MKIQNKSKIIIGVCLFIAVTFFAAAHLREKKEPVVFKRPPDAGAPTHVNSMTGDDVTDLYCRIMLMPKSMVPAIEQLSKHKLAKDIKILPASIEWNDGCMLAVIEKTVIAYDNPELKETLGKNNQAEVGQSEEIAEEDLKKLHPALFYLFLANASQGEINY